jgi:hypothetical protein
MAKIKEKASVINRVIKKNSKKQKKQVSQLSIKIDKKLDKALIVLSSQLLISKNKLIEDILFESRILDVVNEEYGD